MGSYKKVRFRYDSDSVSTRVWEFRLQYSGPRVKKRKFRRGLCIYIYIERERERERDSDRSAYACRL